MKINRSLCLKCGILIFLLVMSVIAFLPNKESTLVVNKFDALAYNSVINSVQEPVKYTDILTNDWKNKEVINMNSETIRVSQYFIENQSASKNNDIDYSGSDYTAEVEAGQTLSARINVSEKGLYRLNFDYYDMTGDILPAEASFAVNGEFQYYEATQAIFLGKYFPDYDDFKVDRYGNEIPISFTKNNMWLKSGINDGSKLRTDDLLIYLNNGDNIIDITLKSGHLLFGNFYLENEEVYDDYNTYIKQYSNQPKNNDLITFEVEYMTTKDDLSTTVYSDSSPTSDRYSPSKQLMNAINPSSFDTVHQSIKWEVNVENAGLYNLTFKAQQSGLVDLPVGRNIEINGEIPFSELKNYQFYYNRKFSNYTLSDSNNQPFYIYFEEGVNTIEMEVCLDTYIEIIEEIDDIMEEMRDTSLAIKKITGGVVDQYRDWNLTKYMPEIVDKLNDWQSRVNELDRLSDELSQKKGGSGEFYNLEKAVSKFKKLLKEPDQLPNYMNIFTDGTSSISQLLGDLSNRIKTSPLTLEKLYIHNENDLPKPNPNIFVSAFNTIQRFFLSFTTVGYSSGDVAPDELDVWVKRSRQYVELMQKKIDEEFTPNTGIKVKLSVMPDENKLVLSNAAKQTPDVAMGVSNWIPYELSLRGLTVDFRQFEGFEEMIENHAPGAFIPYAFGDGMYGIPETQDFWLSFYRDDILNSVGLTPEKVDEINTWNDVVNNLPLLQSYGMNYCHPLATFVGLKAFTATLPFIYQFEGSLYTDDGLKAQINSEENIEALTFMTDLFSIYSIPEQVPSFYNEFRYGTLPMGVANSGIYSQLLVAAPEISGNWSLGLHPGVYSEERDEVLHYSSTGSQGIMMFNRSEKQQQGFDFIKWWLSTEVQTEYIYELNSTYGAEFMWFSANQEAFKSMPIPQEHKEVILEQWEWSMEASRIPGAYIVEREISDGFSKIIFNGKNARVVLDEANINANIEILRKMQEFGYVDSKGNPLKEHPIPTASNIHKYLTER